MAGAGGFEPPHGGIKIAVLSNKIKGYSECSLSVHGSNINDLRGLSDENRREAGMGLNTEQLLFEGGVNLYRLEHGTWPDLPTACAFTPYWSRSTVYRRLKAYRLYCDRDPHGGFWVTPPPPDVPHPADVERIKRLAEVASWTAGPETEPVKLAETGQPKRETGTGRAETERLTV